ncbi:MAG: hypothetical protein IPM21_18230 [Acidobacteria bacterium]|nr:hypothetical protein [Acidobacteriota bacterium]
MKNQHYLTLIFTIMLMTIGLQAQTYNSNAGGYNGGYGQVYQSFGLAQATISMQQNTQMQIQKLMMQQAMEKKFGKAAVAKVQSGSNTKTATRGPAFFTPVSKSDNFKIIADSVGQDAEQRTLFKQLFSEAKKGFDAEMAPKGRKNNLAAAMTFFIASTVTVYNDDPEPSDEATENLFQALTAMYEETPGMTEVPNRDKQFLHDAFVSFSAIPLTFYMAAKEKDDAEMMKLAKVTAGALLLEILKINPNDVRFEGSTLKLKTAPSSNEAPQNTAPQQTSSGYGITKFTTTFDDGWVATPLSDYVGVEKDGVEVRLYFPDARIDGNRPQNTNNFEPYYWDVFVKSSFNVKQAFVREKEQYSMGQSDNYEAAATDKQTGKSRYVGMGLAFFNGSCWTIVVNAPDRKTYYSMFPNDSSLKQMLNYNKFGVAEEDLIGKWSSFDAASIQFYNIYSGDLAGMATASTNDSFVFYGNGTYQSEHAGTSTFRGSLAHGKSNYRGTFRANDWNLTLSNRGANDPGEFSSQFEAVKGGFMLNLVSKKFSGMKMSLYKIKQ